MKSQIELETKVKQIFHNHGEGQAVDTSDEVVRSRNFGATLAE